ncbi:hypothetical protein AAF712_006478 [Marasmius tenuissimus]|uniref:Monopolin complex subunit Csm1/Pcs1 C-terminal domain-containing protein n=1 Tax=Marasmius tenuissimus TaxID=585030 RepID=A0ABR2ZZF1_9AGAR
MSSDDGDDSDLGGLGPTTPAPPPRTTAAKRNPRSTKSQHVNTDAGPSKQTARRTGRTRLNSMEPEKIIYVDEDQDQDELASVHTESTMPQQPRKTSVPARATSARPQTVNGNKGKQKAAPRSRTTRKQSEPEVEVIEDSGDEEQEVDLVPSLAPVINDSGTSGHARHRQPAKDSAVIRERKRAEEAEARCQDLLKQLDEINRIRVSEPEKLLEAFQEQHRVEIETKEKLINELNSALAKVEPLSKSGKSSVLNLLTREAADEEKKGILHQVSKLKEAVAQRDVAIQEKDKLIKEKEDLERIMEQEVEDLRRERENLVKKPPGSAQRGRGNPLGYDDPKHTEVIKFYEDSTNLLIPHLKVQPGNHGKDDWILTCIYSYVGDGESPPTKSLNFSLRTSYENKAEPNEHPRLVQTMFYVPQMLEMEPAEFVAKLGFLGSSFSFPRTQLPLFLRTMYDTIGGALDSNDSDVEVVDA